MKKLFLIAITVLCNFTCNNSSDDIDFIGTLTATINGKKIESIAVQTDVEEIQGSVPLQQLTIAANMESGSGLIIQISTFDDFLVNKTFETINISSGDNEFTAIIYADDNQNFVNLEENTNALVQFNILEAFPGGNLWGTFSGILKETDTGELLEIVDGEFNVRVSN